MAPIMIYLLNYLLYGVKIAVDKIKFILLCFSGVVISNLSGKLMEFFN